MSDWQDIRRERRRYRHRRQQSWQQKDTHKLWHIWSKKKQQIQKKPSNFKQRKKKGLAKHTLINDKWI